MKKTLLFTVALISIAGSASAADLPSIKSAPAPAPLMTWTGFYAGLNVGGAVGHSSISTSSAPVDPWGDPNNVSHASAFITYMPWYSNSTGIALANSGSARINQVGVMGGLQFGYNKQINEKFVAGLEADFQGSSLSGNGGFTAIGTDSLCNSEACDASKRNSTLTTSISTGVNWFGTVRGKIGYLITPQVLAYATGGLSYGGVYANIQNYGLSSYTSFTTPPAFGGYAEFTGYTPINGNKGQQTNVLVGWNAGGGFEWMFAQNWSAKAEAFYYDLGSWTLPSTVYGAAKGTANSLRYPLWYSSNSNRVNYNGVVARLGVNYHFNLANVAPVIAKF